MFTGLVNNKSGTLPVHNKKQFFFPLKLSINQSNDICEQGAEAMADHVIHDNAVQQTAVCRNKNIKVI